LRWTDVASFLGVEATIPPVCDFRVVGLTVNRLLTCLLEFVSCTYSQLNVVFFQRDARKVRNATDVTQLTQRPLLKMRRPRRRQKGNEMQLNESRPLRLSFSFIFVALHAV